jgi:ParB/RepB/Spo0J family partition protein
MVKTMPGRKVKLVVPPQPPKLKASKLQVFDIPDDLLLDHSDNPNEQDDSTFDLLVQHIRDDGFDEPITVVPSLKEKGKYLIVSGHHRRKAGKLAGMGSFPSVIKQGWDEDKAAMELVSRNALRGKLNPEKFSALVNKLRTKGYDLAIIQAQMGFTKSDAFQKLYQQAMDALPKAAKAKLADAKETIKSVDGLSSVLNNIFTEHGSDLDHGFIVFNFGNKDHHYVETDNELHGMMTRLEERCRNENLDIRVIFKTLLRDPNRIDTTGAVRASGAARADVSEQPQPGAAGDTVPTVRRKVTPLVRQDTASGSAV